MILYDFQEIGLIYFKNMHTLTCNPSQEESGRFSCMKFIKYNHKHELIVSNI